MMHFCDFEVYPKVKVRASELEIDYDRPEIPPLDFDSFSIAMDSKHASSPSIAKVPSSYIPRSITPPHSLPKVAKKSEQEAEDSSKPHIQASSVPRPRAVVSSPVNDQIVGTKNKTRLEQRSALKNHNMAQSRYSEGKCFPTSTTAKKPLKREGKSKETAHMSDAKGKEGLPVYVRVPRANIVKAKPCFTTT